MRPVQWAVSEQSAKAMAYALMQIALAEERLLCDLFSSEHITYELTRQDGLVREASDFLSYSFHGGTENSWASTNEVDRFWWMGDKYKNADLIVLSDFYRTKAVWWNDCSSRET